jgi:hypothetical protein
LVGVAAIPAVVAVAGAIRRSTNRVTIPPSAISLLLGVGAFLGVAFQALSHDAQLIALGIWLGGCVAGAAFILFRIAQVMARR